MVCMARVVREGKDTWTLRGDWYSRRDPKGFWEMTHSLWGGMMSREDISPAPNNILPSIHWFHLNGDKHSREYWDIEDVSGGCGQSYSVVIVSEKFIGKPLLQRHRMVNSILAEELKSIHAFQQKTLTPEQFQKQNST